MKMRKRFEKFEKFKRKQVKKDRGNEDDCESNAGLLYELF